MGKSRQQLMAALSPKRRKRIGDRVMKIIREERARRERRLMYLATRHMVKGSDIVQSSIARLAKRPNILLSTLCNHVRKIGGELVISAQFPDREAPALVRSRTSSTRRAAMSRLFARPTAASTMPVMSRLLTDHEITERVLSHITNRTTDVGDGVWREPVENYRSQERFAAEMDRVLRRGYTAFCPSSALPEPGSYLSRDAAGRPIVAVRGQDGVVRAFQNVCRHRGMRVASEQGCAKAFVCPYHGWTYELNGRLRHVPHAEGFPGLDQARHGLAPLDAVERHGVVFVSQTKGAAQSDLAGLPELIAQSQRLYSTNARDTEANWKIVLEGFLEGYHIRPTHPETFYPYGFDNLNVIEQIGRHSRVTFPFRRIEKLAAVPSDERRVMGFVTFVYHIFPNALITVLSNHTNLLVLEPLTVDRTRVVSYSLTNRSGDAAEVLEAVTRDEKFTAIGAEEDRAMVSAIQRGVASDANESFVFGRFESAIVHFHRTLTAALAGG